MTSKEASRPKKILTRPIGLVEFANIPGCHKGLDARQNWLPINNRKTDNNDTDRKRETSKLQRDLTTASVTEDDSNI